MTPDDLVAHCEPEPIPREGGRFRQTRAGPARPDARPGNTAIVALLTDAPGDFPAPHRPPADTVPPGLIDREGPAEERPEGVRRRRQASAVGRTGCPEDIGDACACPASPFASWVSGHDLVADGGVSARPPW
ncbi:SDR family oxidoreductase [Streptomyces heliomycini]|uniref:SDR family oxidoreductase n=1 Tax=Streptomyces heliomycini TaxID=284032 RepID=A0ABV5LK48_9ACTN|nr:SDR family oxidoreductase [Streptomyces sp. XY152]